MNCVALHLQLNGPSIKKSIQTEIIFNHCYFPHKLFIALVVFQIYEACQGYLAWRSLDMDIVSEQIKFLNTDRPGDSLTGGWTEGRRALIFVQLSIDPCG